MQHGSSLRSFFLLTILCLLFAPSGLLAQRPVSVKLPKGDPVGQSLGWKMECNDAGEINRFSGFNMESTSFGDNLMPTDFRPYGGRPDTIFMCADDEFNVNLIVNSADITGDPNLATQAGVGYAFYRCAPPTVTGPTLADIAADMCVADNGLSPFDELAIGVPVNYAVGDYTLTLANDNVGGFTIPGLFPVGGEPTPVVLTLAPITFDDADLTIGEAIYEGSPIGSCVNVSTTQTFTVAYLNPINIANPSPSPVAGCEGLFDVRGGTPELRGGTGYNILIENIATGARAAILTAPEDIIHNGVVRYQVPTAGTYRITIEDGNSCSLGRGAGVTVIHTDGCPQPVTLNLPLGGGEPGQSICVPVTVENFTDILAFQFDLDFDPAVLRFDNLNGFHPNLAGSIQWNGPISSGGTLREGLTRVLYTDNFAGPSTVPDGEALFSICFTILGQLGDDSPLINVDPGAEYTRDPMEVDMLIVNPGSIVVTDRAFLVELTREDENCEGFNDGRITATANGAQDPYIFSIRRILPSPEAMFHDAATRTGNPASATFNGLEDAEYAVQVVAANGDIVIDTIEVEAGLDIGVNITPVNQPSCNGFSDGSIRAVVTESGVEVVAPLAAGYTFAWQNSTETGDVRTGLTSGQYQVTVTSPIGGCTSFATGNLSQPADVRVRPDNPADAVSNATCTGSPDGSITITADGGTGPYDFIWPNTLGTDLDMAASNRLNLLPAAYEVIVEDSRGCRDTSNFVVDAQKVLGIVSEVDSITCFGDANGAFV